MDPRHQHTTPSTGDIAAALREAGLVERACPGPAGDAPIHGCTVDSREVKPGDLFFCKGARFQARYLVDAVEAGAACFVAPASQRAELDALDLGDRAAAIYVNDVRRAMAVASPVVYGHPDRAVKIVGITGTKGKSTTEYMLKSIFEAAGERPAIMGSIDTDDGIEHFESHNTTPEAPELWRHVANCRDSGHGPLVMEVSSQGLKYGRVEGLHLDIACFLNIGRDHISPIEHPDFEDYFQSKLRIFEQCGTAVVNLGSDHVERVLRAARAAARIVTIGVDRPEADLCAAGVRGGRGGIDFELRCAPALRAPDAPGTVHVGIPGLFNAENALAAIASARLLGVPFPAIERGLASFRVPGRMEVVRTADGRITAIVDYAHNALSFRALFASVEHEYPGHQVIAVFGAPGDKAKERREQLPREAAPHCDLLIFTEEDPAHERVEDICAEMASHVPSGTPCEIVCDRERAIERAFEAARADARPSVVLLLAKGDETRQHRGDDFPAVKSDLAIARELAGQA